MTRFDNCTTRSTGLSAPHTIYLDGIGTSILRGDLFSLYRYCADRNMVRIATAVDHSGHPYDIFADAPDIHTATRRIAIPTTWPNRREEAEK